jgi:hypothetical protein
MNTFMKATALAAALSVVISGNAIAGGQAANPFGANTASPTSEQTTNAPTQAAPATANTPFSKFTARRKAMRAGLKGCGMGAAMGMLSGLLGGGLNPKAVLAGCAVGGVTTAVTEYQNQLAEARALQGTVTVGAVTKVNEKTVVVEGEKVAALDSVTVNIERAAIKSNSEAVRKIMERVASLADRAKDPTTVTIYGSTAERAWMKSALTFKAGSTVKVVEVHSSSPHLVMSPLPVIGN